jgi:periplasmic copper chaperone A
MGGSDDMDGASTPDGFAMMGMREIEALDVPAGETVSLTPGGHHLMLLELADDLVPGETFEMTLEFAASGELTVTVEVLEDV